MFFVLLLFSGAAYAEVGFHFVDSSSPMAIRKSEPSVFQLLAPGGEEITIDIKGETEESLAEIAQTRAEDRWRPDLRAPMILAQLLLCQEQGKELCPFFEGLKASTAFLLKDPHKIVATYHGVAALVESLEARGLQVEGKGLPITLLNEEGEAVRTSLTLEKKIPPGENPGLDLSFFSSGGLEGGIPLASVTKSDEETYALGFSSSTFTRGRLGKQDALTDHLTFTKGREVSALRAFLSSASSFHRTDHDGNGGLSGGPILNEAGEVVAVVAEGVFEDRDEAPEALLSSEIARALGELGV